MNRRNHLFTSESVTEGHPDKIADQISDAILDAIMTRDPLGRVACETAVTTGLAFVIGEITTDTYVDIQDVARTQQVILDPLSIHGRRLALLRRRDLSRLLCPNQRRKSHEDQDGKSRQNSGFHNRPQRKILNGMIAQNFRDTKLTPDKSRQEIIPHLASGHSAFYGMIRLSHSCWPS